MTTDSEPAGVASATTGVLPPAGTSTSPSVTAQTKTAGAGDVPTSGTTPTSMSTAQGAGPSDKAAMVGLLRRYAAAYSARDPEALRRHFTRNVFRHGFQRGGCGNAYGRRSVVEAYAAQFALGTGRYTLTGVSQRAIQTARSHPTVNTRYAIAGGNDGRLAVQFSKSNGRWLISRLNSHC